MASSPLDDEIRLVLRKLKKECARMAIESQLKKHVTIIKDLVNSVPIAIIANHLSGVGVSGSIKDIIAAITALLGDEVSVTFNKEEDNQQNNLSQPSALKPPSPKKQPKSLPLVDTQESPTSPPSTAPTIEPVAETPTPIAASNSNTAVTTSGTYNVPNRRTPEMQAKLDAAKAGQALQQAER